MFGPVCPWRASILCAAVTAGHVDFSCLRSPFVRAQEVLHRFFDGMYGRDGCWPRLARLSKKFSERVGILFEGLKRAEAALQRLFLGVLGLIWGCFRLFREIFYERLTSGTGFGIITNSSDKSKDKAVEAKRAL